MSAAIRAELFARREALTDRWRALDVDLEGRGDEADIADAGVSRHFHMARRESLRQGVHAIDVALERLAAGTYGDCVDCGNAIAPVRLRVYPDAETCIGCQEKREKAAAADGARDRRPSPYPADLEQGG